LARREVPYYRRADRRCIEDYPVLDKRTIWDNLAALQAEGAAPIGSGHPDAAMATTSGSSGRRLKVYVDRGAQAWGLAATWFGELWPGSPGNSSLGLTDGTAFLWGASDYNSGAAVAKRKRIRNLLRNERSYPCFTLNASQVRSYHAELHRHKPARIIGYVSNLVRFAQLANEQGLSPLSCAKVVPTAEQLDGFSRGVIDSQFQAPLRERFGGREIGAVAQQCEHGQWHLFSLLAYPEVLRDDGSIAAHGSGQLLLTRLTNRRMPLIRYNIEDRVVIPPPGGPPCPCGRPFPLMTALQGRELDLLRFADGTTLHGLAIAECFRGSDVLQFIFVQDSAVSGSLLIVPGPGFDTVTREQIEGKLTKRLAGRLEAATKIVDQIPAELSDPNHSGKARQVVCLASADG
jgi:phenylacetate-CoA ligase